MKNILEGPNSRLGEQKKDQWFRQGRELIQTQQQKDKRTKSEDNLRDPQDNLK